MVERWPHLQGHVYLSDLNSGVDLLIGADVPEALQPREVIPALRMSPNASTLTSLTELLSLEMTQVLHNGDI